MTSAISDAEREALERIAVPLCVFEWADWRYHVAAVSDGVAELLGMKREELIGEDGNLAMKVHPEDQAALDNMKKYVALHPDAIYPMTFRVQRADKTYIWVKAQSKARRANMDDGERLIFYVTYSDFTAEEEMRRAQDRARKRSGTLMEKIMETTQTPIFWKDAQRRFQGVNKAFLDYYGVPSSHVLLGKTDEDMGWNIEIGKFKSDEEEVLKGKLVSRQFGHCIRKGETRDILANKTPLKDEHGRIVGLVGSFIDVTDEIRRMGQNERLLMALDNVPTGICLYDFSSGEPRCIMMNKYLAQFTGIMRDAVEQRPFDAILPFVLPADRSKFKKRMMEIAIDSQDFDMSLSIQRAGGGYAYMHVIGTRVKDGLADRIYVSMFDVTRLKKVQQTRRAEREILQKALDIVHVLVWTYDVEAKSLTFIRSDASDSERMRIGLEETISPLPDALMDWVADDDRAKFADHIAKVNQGMSSTVDIGFHRPNESESRIYRITHLVTLDPSTGAPYSAYGIAQDITDEKRAEKKYHDEVHAIDSSAPHNLVAKGHYNLTSNRVVEHWARDGRVLDIKPDMTYDEVAREMVMTVSDDSTRQTIEKALERDALIARAYEGERSFSIEFRHEQKGCLPFWALLTLNMFSLESGDIEAFIYIYDITTALIRREIISKFPLLGYDAIGLINLDKNIIFMYDDALYDSNSMGETENYTALISRRVEKYCLKDKRGDVRQALSIETIREKLLTQPVYDVSYDYVGNGERLRKHMQFCHLSSFSDYVFYCRSDVTEQHKKEIDQMARLKNALETAEQANEARTMFLASMSHDMRTPLNGILGFTRLAIGTSSIVKQRDYLQKILFSGSLLLSLVNETLTLSRLESGKYILQPEDVPFRDVVDGVVVPVEVSAQEHDVSFVTQFDDPPAPLVRVDRLKLQEILLNLLSNAVKFTPEGGSIIFTIKFPSGGELDDLAEGCNTRISVSDSGIGISKSFLSKIFEPFTQERTKSTQNISGTGLGLAIVKRIIDRMGGVISVDSEVGHGARFVVDLPLTFIDGTKNDERVAKGTVDFKGKKVLLVEDNFLNQEIAKTLLEEKEFIVDTAEDGSEAVEKFKSSMEGEYSIILMDIRMPNMDGYDATSTIRKLERKDAATVPILAMTADAYAEDVKHCLDVGMQGHIAKPIDPVKMFDAIAKWIK